MGKIRPHANQGHADQTGSGPAASRLAVDSIQGHASILQNRDRIARLLRLFSSPRKRSGLTPDELLIFVAIGYLCMTISNGTVRIMPIGLIDVSMLLGIPKETVRRKIARLTDLDYVSCTPSAANSGFV